MKRASSTISRQEALFLSLERVVRSCDQIFRFSVERTPMALRATWVEVVVNVCGEKEKADKYLGLIGLVGVFDDGLEVSQDFTFGENRSVVFTNDIEPVC
jgi:hypothetical protein